jgi:hypothetical protein
MEKAGEKRTNLVVKGFLPTLNTNLATKPSARTPNVLANTSEGFETRRYPLRIDKLYEQ